MGGGGFFFSLQSNNFLSNMNIGLQYIIATVTVRMFSLVTIIFTVVKLGCHWDIFSKKVLSE